MSLLCKAFFCLVLVCGMGSMQGCSKSSSKANELGSLSGKVTYKGNPLTGGNLILKSKDKGDTVIRINGDGTYEGTAIPQGEYPIAIDTEPVKMWLEQKGNIFKFDPKDIDKIKNQKTPPTEFADPFKGMVYVEIPKKYANPQQSGLSVVIKEGKQQKDFPLD